MSKTDKILKNENQIAQALQMILEARYSVENLINQYDGWIVEASAVGDEAYSDQLIDDQIELEDFAQDLKVIEIRIRESAVTSRVFSKLKALPKALDCCKQLAAGLNVPKLGKQMNEFKKNLDAARASLKELRGETSMEDKVRSNLFGEDSKVDITDSKAVERLEARRQAKRQQREASLMKEVEKNVVAPVPSGISEEKSETNIDEIILTLQQTKNSK